MRPKPFLSERYNGSDCIVRDTVSDTIWHRIAERTLYADTDRSTWVYHANYLHYFERGRASLMRDFNYSYRDIEERGFVYPIIEQAITYYHPLGYDDPMWIHTRPGTLERVRITFHYVITHQESGALVCMGHTKHCALKASGVVTGVDPSTVEIWKSFPK